MQWVELERQFYHVTFNGEDGGERCLAGQFDTAGIWLAAANVDLDAARFHQAAAFLIEDG